MNKQKLRKEFLEKRMALSKSLVQAWSEDIEKQVLELVLEKNFQVIFLYAAFRNEPETKSLLKQLIALGKTVALPKCISKGEMTMYRVTDISTLQSGAYGILEPTETEVAMPEAADLVLVPGCAFGRDMTRLGYGGGYYDRYLPLCTKAVKAGLCYENCLTETLPTDSFDAVMDCVITEKKRYE